MMAEFSQASLGGALQLLHEGRTDEGIVRLRAIVQADDGALDAWGHLAWQLALAGRHAEALEALDAIVRRNPENLEALWRRADRLVRLGRLEAAEAQYGEVLARAPDCHDARTGLTYVDWLKKRRPGASASSRDDRPGSANAPAAAADRRAALDNAERARAHLARGDVRLTSQPFHIHIESTTRCNAWCLTCAKGHRAYFAQDMSPEVFARIERDLLPAAAQVNLTGSGEPLLSRGFDGFYDQAARAGARVYLVTNATTLTLERIETFARRPTDVIASIDAATADTFEAIRRPARFERVTESLRLYRKVRDVWPEVGSTLGINFVAMRRNIEELPALVDLAADLGAQFVAVLDFATGDVPPAIALEHLAHTPDLANRLFDEAAERARARGVTLLLPPKFAAAGAPPVAGASWRARWRRIGRLLPARGRFPRRCPDPWTTVLVATDGLVHPCCASRRVMGDLRTQRLDAIWNGRRYRWFRRTIRTALPPPECRACNQLWGVNAGNPTAVRAREGLIVKALYRMKARMDRMVGRLRDRLFPTEPTPPNYEQGRPIGKQEK